MTAMLPGQRQALTQNNLTTSPFYRWFEEITRAVNSGALSNAEIAAAVKVLQSAKGYLPLTTTIQWGPGFGVTGSLADNTLSVALAQLQVLVNSGLGSGLAITVDKYGRVTGTRPLLPSDIPSDLASYLVDEAGNYLVDEAGNFLVSAPPNTDNLAEGLSNFYFTDERAQDALAAAFAAGTQTGITIVYDDANNKFNFTVAGGAGSGITRTIASVAVNTTAGAAALTDYVFFLSAGAALTMPTAVGNTSRYTIKNVDPTLNSNVTSTAAQTFDGTASPAALVPGQSFDLFSDNANWKITG